MPLMVMVGLPCSGKSTRARQLAEYLEQDIIKNSVQADPSNSSSESSSSSSSSSSINQSIKVQPKVIIINEESLNIDRAQAYQNATEEKKARGALMSAVERELSQDKIVILDSMNYIKGYRYQLFCVSKNLGTPQLTFYCITPPETTIIWNTSRPTTQAYPPDIHSSLLPRFEEPESRNRWDNPLVGVLPEDDILSVAPRVADILLRPERKVTPHQSVITKPVAAVNYLHERDAAIRAVAEAVLEAGRDGLLGNKKLAVSVTAEGVVGVNVSVEAPNRVISVSEMGRLRRQYATTLTKLEARLTPQEVAVGFSEFINKL